MAIGHLQPVPCHSCSCVGVDERISAPARTSGCLFQRLVTSRGGMLRPRRPRIGPLVAICLEGWLILQLDLLLSPSSVAVISG